MKECPSCGYAVDENMAFCPVCGSKVDNVNNAKKKSMNAELENDLARAEMYASSVLYTKSNIVLKEVDAGELNFTNLIDRYPTESKVYIAYVNYMVKYIDRVMNPQKGDETIYFKDFNRLVGQCKMFLNNAAKYNTENDYEVLQEISRLQGCLESLKMNQPEIDTKNRRNKRIAIWSSVIIIVIAILAIIAYLL